MNRMTRVCHLFRAFLSVLSHCEPTSLSTHRMLLRMSQDFTAGLSLCEVVTSEAEHQCPQLVLASWGSLRVCWWDPEVRVGLEQVCVLG